MFLTALDLGSSQIKILVSETSNGNKLSLLDVLKFPSQGIRKGEVVDVQEASQAITMALNEVKKNDKNAVKNIFVNISGKNINTQSSRGIVAVSRADNEIYQDDVDRAVKASQAVNFSSKNRKIIHTIIQEYIIDGEEQVQSPLSMSGNRLEVNSLIVDAFSPIADDLNRAIEMAGGKVFETVYNPIASSGAILTKTNKELGVVLVDIGFGTTSMAIFEENKLIGAKVFPIGASNITNDLAVALKSSIQTAEKIKLSYGHALIKEVSLKDKVDLFEIDKTLKSVISRKFICEIIEVRLAEIFELVHNELKVLGKTQLPGGVVLAGGGSKMSGIIDLAKQELMLPAHLAHMNTDIFDATNRDSSAMIEDLEFSTALGLLYFGSNVYLDGGNGWMSNKKDIFSRVFRNLMP
ncbi:cell division protein FtsA [Candidatus Wolfebacteria bacterium CG10_big_fil_rev_8_21_14_0_10_31_9]|uniref:Cell division protein FtsA n=1 Tax=Candidatus Wolfebacteria bacterium CG10_big_fil_rev_8_21_14_0_10_31_9 TaxID=1975070 RepID=A0A2H0RCI1_9BACT|nr:MAG: cell division protein FtsA [Candidatus Wolfebacteria bacterium CG10_big_fil_rev_8_21_14_0_10_31_9]